MAKVDALAGSRRSKSGWEKGGRPIQRESVRAPDKTWEDELTLQGKPAISLEHVSRRFATTKIDNKFEGVPFTLSQLVAAVKETMAPS